MVESIMVQIIDPTFCSCQESSRLSLCAAVAVGVLLLFCPADMFQLQLGLFTKSLPGTFYSRDLRKISKYNLTNSLQGTQFEVHISFHQIALILFWKVRVYVEINFVYTHIIYFLSFCILFDKNGTSKTYCFCPFETSWEIKIKELVPWF